MARRPKSANGRYIVMLSRPFTHLGFTYKPGRVDASEALLKVMSEEEGLVANVIPSA